MHEESIFFMASMWAYGFIMGAGCAGLAYCLGKRCCRSITPVDPQAPPTEETAALQPTSPGPEEEEENQWI